jgi:uncharacterized protein YbaR (Trm112 family)
MIGSSALKAKMVAGASLILLFGSGVVVGLAWDQTASARTVDEVRTEESSREGDRSRRLVVDDVGLSSVQRASVDSLVVFHRARMADLNGELRTRSHGVIYDLREDIKQLLTDDQRMTYDVLLAEYDAERAARRRNKSAK